MMASTRAVDVFVRVRPPLRAGSGTDASPDDAVRVVPPPAAGGASSTPPTDVEVALTGRDRGGYDRELLRFRFNRVFDARAKQKELFDAVLRPVIDDDLLSGVNCSVLCYGVSGSGKSYTMGGGVGYAARGLVPRAIAHVFEARRRAEATAAAGSGGDTPVASVAVTVSFMEVYN